MSEVYLELTIANIKHLERQQEVSFLVDTGATRAWVSKEIAESVGIEPVGTVPLELADGSITERPYGFCLFAYNGEIAAGNVVIGPLGCEPLVGTHVLQDFRLIVDLERHEVTRGRAMRAKRERQVLLEKGLIMSRDEQRAFANAVRTQLSLDREPPSLEEVEKALANLESPLSKEIITGRGER